MAICSICHDEFPSGIKINKISLKKMLTESEQNHTATQTKCNHLFHTNCIHKWIEIRINKDKTPNCPLCRVPFMEVKNIESHGQVQRRGIIVFHRQNAPTISLQGLIPASDSSEQFQGRQHD